MSFWEDLSPLVKRYVIVGAVLLGGLLVVRSCTHSQSAGTLPPRGLSR